MFKDYYEGIFCDSNEEFAFAIEPEISEDFFRSSGLDWNDYKNESNNIVELLGVHKLSKEKRMEVHDAIKKQYRDKFPIGQDEHLSGGVHAVLFGDFSEFREKGKEIEDNLLNCPLFLKIYNGYFYGRDISDRAEFTWRERLGLNEKGYAVCLKSSLYSHSSSVEGMPIEFRCNNVFDERILGYYQGILLAVRDGVKFEAISDNLVDYVSTGDGCYYTYGGGDGYDIHVSQVEGIKAKEEDRLAIKNNINTILSLLRKEGLNNSADALIEYLKEMNFKK